jgi:cation diffusion facilitator CzcD-associated flavoprotein CzcO
MKTDYQIAIIGSGFLGMNMAIQLLKNGISDFIILEQSGDVGGVWRDNSYPGAACDIPSHLYSLKDEPNPYWPKMFSDRKEIYSYLQTVAKKHNIARYTQFNSKVIGAKFDSANSCWELGIEGLKSIRVQFVIPALGPLNVPSYPKIAGIDAFEGIKVHTSQWDETLNFKDKNIAIIGTGASAVQAIPTLAKAANKLFVFQRTASWILPKLRDKYDEARQQKFAKFPLLMRFEREKIFWRQELFYFLFKKPDGKLSTQFKNFGLSYLKNKVKDPELRQKLTPDFTIGCKRLLFSNEYLPALQQDNVEVINDSIERITTDSIITKTGKESKIDILVFATGFSPGDVNSLNISTKSNKSIMDVWNNIPRAYKGILTHDCPNMFFILGPNTGLGHNSVLHIGESQATYIVKVLLAMEKKQLKTIEVKKDAEDKYMKQVYSDLEKRVWQSGGCNSWYKNAQGVNFTLWPNSCTDYRREVASVKLNDFITA